jgi:PQQ enzyme repeat
LTPADTHPCTRWLRAGLAVALLAAPDMSARMMSQPLTSAERDVRAAAPAMRFSQLTDITPANVGGLMPLVARSPAAIMPDPPLDSSTAAKSPLQRFADERPEQLALRREERARPLVHGGNYVVTYVVGSAGTDLSSRPAPAALAQRELRAWDPIERHVLWSVRETLSISSGMLVTAGGLVFYGTVDGWFKALDATTGRVLWKHRVEDKRLDTPMSYRGADGHQYIAVRAVPRRAGAGSETLLLFALAN